MIEKILTIFLYIFGVISVSLFILFFTTLFIGIFVYPEYLEFTAYILENKTIRNIIEVKSILFFMLFIYFKRKAEKYLK